MTKTTGAESTEWLTLRGIIGSANVAVALAVQQLDASGVTAAHFSEQRPRALFTAIAEALRNGERPEALTLMKACGSTVPRDAIVGLLASGEKGTAPQRLAVLRESAERRARAADLRRAAELLERDGVGLDAAEAEVQRILASPVAVDDTQRSAGLDVDDIVARVHANATGAREPILRTGIPPLDEAVGGLQPTLTIIGAMEGTGKSALIAAIVRNLTWRGIQTGLLSLEDQREWVTQRILAEAAGISVFDLQFGRLGTQSRQRLDESKQEVAAALQHLVVDDSSGLNADEVVVRARRMVASGCKAVIVDHLGEVLTPKAERHDLGVKVALAALRDLSKKFRIPVVVACHMRRREGLDMHEVPLSTDIAESAYIGRMARVVLGLYRIEFDRTADPPLRLNVPQMGVVVLKQTAGSAGHRFELNINAQAGIVGHGPSRRALPASTGGIR